MNNNSFFRSFTFYNDRTNNFRHPISAETGDVKAFRTLGYFDEFKTEKFIVNQTNGDMDFLWKYINSMNESLIDLDKQYFIDASFQNIFGVPCNWQLDKDPKEVSDEAFWKKDEYAYTFIVLVQFFSKDSNNIKLEHKVKAYKKSFCNHVDEFLKGYKKYFLQGKHKNPDIESLLCDNELTTKYIISDYLTFDRYDYILTIKSNCYLPIVLAMQQLYSLHSLDKGTAIALNSFTVTAIKKTDDLINEVVPSICIKCNYDENNIFSFNCNNEYDRKFNVFSYINFFDKQQLYNILYPNIPINNTDHRLYYISGEDDIRIIAREVETHNLFNLFDSNSILGSKYLYGFSTIINVFYDNGKEKNYTLHETNNVIEKEIKNCKRIIQELGSHYPSELVKTLYQINSGLSAIRPINPNYRGYGFYSLFVEFKNFLSILHELPMGYNDSVIYKSFKVIHSFGSALLTTVRSDFREFQIPTFNANLYYAPTKMLVFYRAFIAKLINSYNLLNEGSVEHFIINTGNEIATRVIEMLSITNINGNNEKIFVCSMSEKNIYMLKNSMIQLNHEVAHFGLKRIRNRTNRVNYITDSYMRSYVTIFKYFLYDELTHKNEFGNETAFSLFEYINKESFYCFFINKLRIEYLKTSSYNPNDSYYLEETINTIKVKLKKCIGDFKDAITNNLLDYFSISSQGKTSGIYKEYNILCQMIEKSFNRINQILLSNFREDSIDNFDYFIKYYFRECFADVIAILTLNLSPDEYLDAILKVAGINAKPYSKDVLTLDFRFYIIFHAINKYLNDSTTSNNNDFSTYNSNHDFIQKWNKKNHSTLRSTNPEVYEAVKKYEDYVYNLQVELSTSWFEEKTVEFLNNVTKAFEDSDQLQFDEKFLSIFYYEKNLFENFSDYLVNCINLFVRNYGILNDDESDFSPDKIYKKLSSTKKTMTEKILFIDQLLGEFEEDSYIQLVKDSS